MCVSAAQDQAGALAWGCSPRPPTASNIPEAGCPLLAPPRPGPPRPAMLNTLMDSGAPHGHHHHHHTAHHLASMGLKMSPPLDTPPQGATAMPPDHFQGTYGHQIPHPGYAARDFLLRREHHEFGGGAAGAAVTGDPTAAMLFPTALHHQVSPAYWTRAPVRKPGCLCFKVRKHP